jgi:hypothetical protein
LFEIEKVISFQREVDENAVFHFSLHFSYLLLIYMSLDAAFFLLYELHHHWNFVKVLHRLHESYYPVHFTDCISILGCYGATAGTADSSFHVLEIQDVLLS